MLQLIKIVTLATVFSLVVLARNQDQHKSNYKILRHGTKVVPKHLPVHCEVLCYEGTGLQVLPTNPSVNQSSVTPKPTQNITSTTTKAPALKPTTTEGYDEGNNTRKFTVKKLQISRRLHRVLLKQYHSKNHRFHYKEFPDNCQVVCAESKPNEIVPPPETSNSDEEDDNYKPGEDTPVEETVPLNGASGGTVDFEGLSDYGVEGEPAGDSAVIIEARKHKTKKHGRQNKKKKNEKAMREYLHH